MPPVHVTSEIGPLRAVLVHPPGRELVAVTPGTRKDYLYSDIVDLEFAQREHRRLQAVLERFAQTLEIGQTLREVLGRPDVRDFLISKTRDVIPSDALARRLAEMPPNELVSLLIEGAEDTPGPISATLNEAGFSLPPVPNLFFTRDLGMVLGDHAVVGSMRHGARWSEELLIKMLFCFHPEFENAGILYDGSEERRLTHNLEGGDVHPLRQDLLLVGFSARSSTAALDLLCDIVFEQTPITDVLVVVLPGVRSAIHLDMIFTQVDREQCVVYPPSFIGPQRLPVLHRRKGSDTVEEEPNLFAALDGLGMRLDPIFCGGRHRGVQDREQYASGCNMLALRPGLSVGYKRNDATLREMERGGFQVVDAVEFLTGDTSIQERDRAVITIEGSELVRGGGGPRCMTLPLRRDDP